MIGEGYIFYSLYTKKEGLLMESAASIARLEGVVSRLEDLMAAKENAPDWTIEFGAPTSAQLAIGGYGEYVVCNFSVVLELDGGPIGNISGYQVMQQKSGVGHYISPPGTKKRNGGWLNFAGFSPEVEGEIIDSALAKAEAGELVTRYQHKFTDK